jgi:hypothetical protein
LTEIRKFVCDFCTAESAQPAGWLVLATISVRRLDNGKVVLDRKEVGFCGPGCLDRWVHRELMAGLFPVQRSAEATHTGTLSDADLLAACGKVTAAQHEN